MSRIHILSLQNLNNKNENIAFKKYCFGGEKITNKHRTAAGGEKISLIMFNN